MIIIKIIVLVISMGILVNAALNEKTEIGLLGFLALIISLIWILIS